MRRAGDRGVVLVVVLILLVVIGLTASAAMRGAITQEKVVNNLRLEFSAQTQAEYALRFCEAELLKESSSRVSELQGVESLPERTLSTLKWGQPSAWTAPQGSSPAWAFYELDATDIDANGASRPQCLVERLNMGGAGDKTLVVTVRGFSPGYQPGSSNPDQSGSTVWLQSFLYFN